MLAWSQCGAVERTPDRLSGATVEQFLEWFPRVTRQQVEAALDHTARSLTEV